MCLFHGYADETGGEMRVFLRICSWRDGEISIACSAKEGFRIHILAKVAAPLIRLNI